jgi:hypothetical protein
MTLPYILTLPRLHELAAPLYLLLLGAEYLLVTRGALRGHFRREDTHTSLIMGIGSIVGAMVMGTLGGSLVMWAWGHRIATLGFAWWVFALCSMTFGFTGGTAFRTGPAGSGRRTSCITPASTTICRRRCANRGPEP